MNAQLSTVRILKLDFELNSKLMLKECELELEALVTNPLQQWFLKAVN